MVPASGQPSRSLGPTNSSVPTRSATPIGMPDEPEPRGQHRRREDRGRHEERPGAGEQVAEMLADAHAEQPVERGERDLDRASRGLARVAVRRGDVAPGELRDRIRPAHEAERLDERGRGAGRDGERRERRRGGKHDPEQDRERQHGERAQQQRLPAQDQARAAGVEPAQDLVRLLAQDVRVLERPAEREERGVERERDEDEQDTRHDVQAHGVGGVLAPWGWGVGVGSCIASSWLRARAWFRRRTSQDARSRRV